jgi:hypothetical protein
MRERDKKQYKILQSEAASSKTQEVNGTEDREEETKM